MASIEVCIKCGRGFVHKSKTHCMCCVDPARPQTVTPDKPIPECCVKKFEQAVAAGTDNA
jgi:hypothetical protein